MSFAFTDRLKSKEIQISMDGRGRVHDNPPRRVEGLWRSLKHEGVYLKDYASRSELEDGIGPLFPILPGRLKLGASRVMPSTNRNAGRTDPP